MTGIKDSLPDSGNTLLNIEEEDPKDNNEEDDPNQNDIEYDIFVLCTTPKKDFIYHDKLSNRCGL